MNLIQKILHAIGSIFTHVIDALENAYNQLTPAQQLAMQAGSGLVDLINGALDKTPDEIRQLALEKFPHLDEVQLEAGLFKAAAALGVTTEGITNLNDLIKLVQDKLKTFSGSDWDIASHTLAVAFSLAFAPKETRVSTVVLLIEWVYQKFFKKH